jgi:hypothetical protein
MAAENLAAVISSLTSSPFLAAVEEFIDQHPELLRRLAQ